MESDDQASLDQAYRSHSRLFMSRIVLPAVAIVLLSAIPIFAADAARLTVATADPPAEVAQPIRATLDGKVLRLATGDKPFFEFWLRKELPLANKPENGTLDPTTIPEGSVLGVLKVNVQRDDFR